MCVWRGLDSGIQYIRKCFSPSVFFFTFIPGRSGYLQDRTSSFFPYFLLILLLLFDKSYHLWKKVVTVIILIIFLFLVLQTFSLIFAASILPISIAFHHHQKWTITNLERYNRQFSVFKLIENNNLRPAVSKVFDCLWKLSLISFFFLSQLPCIERLSTCRSRK